MARLQRGRNAIAQPIEITDVRVLSRMDLSVLAEPRPANSIKVLRDTHHRVARAVAAGLRADEIATTTGYSLQRINTLNTDPAFKELVAHYRGIITAEFAVTADPVIDYLRTNALKAAAMLSDKLDAASEAEEFLPTRDLLGIAELGFDRTGYGKVNKNVNINVDFAAQLEAARKRSAAARPTQIEARATPPLAPQSASADSPSAPRQPMPSSLRRL